MNAPVARTDRHGPPRGSGRMWAALAMGWLLGICPNDCLAQSVHPPALGQAFGLEIPEGPVQAGGDRRVLTYDSENRPVVGRITVAVGDRYVVLLPDGQLAVRAAADSPATDRPFEPATHESIAESLRQTGLAGFSTHQTRRYLYLYNGSQEFVEVASRILETMFRGVVTYAQVQKIAVHPPEVPLVVLIFRTEDEFQRYRRMPEGVVAYYDVVTNRVALYEETPLWQVKPDLAVRQSIATVAHEGAHQILHNIGVQQRLSHWPMWLAEGLAEFFAPTTTDRYVKWKGAGQVNDLRMFELEQYIKTRLAEESDGQLVAKAVGAARLTSTGYAAAWALTDYLAKQRREDFHAFVRETSRLGPLEGNGSVVPPGVIPENVRLFKSHFGEDLADVERRLILYLQQLPYIDPFADWPHFVAMISIGSERNVGRQANVFHLREQAEQWVRDVTEDQPADSRHRLQSLVREFPNRLLAEQFARAWLQGG